MNELQELEGMMRELLQALEVILGSGEELPDEFMGEIAVTLEKLFNRIEELRGQQTEIPIEPPSPSIEPGMPSSNIEGFAYDDENNKLYVRFLGEHPNRNGPTYSYDNVPPNVFALLRSGALPARTNGRNKWGQWWVGKTPSLGATFSQLVRDGGFPYARVG